MEWSQNQEIVAEDGQHNGLLTRESAYEHVRIPTRPGSSGAIALVHPRALDRECLSRSLREHRPDLVISEAGSISELQPLAEESQPSAVLLVLGTRAASDPSVKAELRDFVS